MNRSDLMEQFGRLASDGPVDIYHQMERFTLSLVGRSLFGQQLANETLEAIGAVCRERGVPFHSDGAQWVGKLPLSVREQGIDLLAFCAHKLYGPKGIGALVLRRGTDLSARMLGGGQEMGRRAGTENLIGIMGFAAAALASQRDLEHGLWTKVEKLRNILENVIADGAKETIFVGNSASRLPNTSCFALPGWKGETQVMQMDLAGFAVSAGSACSSGKLRPSEVLRAMGHDEETARSAIRVSLGPDVTEEDVLRFADAWLKQYRKYRARGA